MDIEPPLEFSIEPFSLAIIHDERQSTTSDSLPSPGESLRITSLVIGEPSDLPSLDAPSLLQSNQFIELNSPPVDESNDLRSLQHLPYPVFSSTQSS